MNPQGQRWRRSVEAPTALELCADLRCGGLTLSRELMNEVRKAVSLPIHVIIRPRAGDFVYNGDEFDQMKRSHCSCA